LSSLLERLKVGDWSCSRLWQI